MGYRYEKLDTPEAKYIEERLEANYNYCPCKLIQNKDTKCMCKEFRETETNTEVICHCGLYKKIKT